MRLAALSATLLAAAAFCAGAGRADGPATPPVVDPPADITATADQGCNGHWCAQVFFDVSASGGYPPYVIDCSHDSGDLYLAGTTTVYCWAHDSGGDMSRFASFTVTVNTPAGDPPPPPAPPPPADLSEGSIDNVVVTAATPCGPGNADVCAFVTIDPIASGGYPPYRFICNLATGYFLVGVHPDACMAQDSEDDSTPEQHFTVTVLGPPADPLALTPPAVVTATAANPCGVSYCAPVKYAMSITGGYAPYSLRCNPASGSEMRVGTQTVTCTAVDAGAETVTTSFTVTVSPPSGYDPPAFAHGANRFHPPRPHRD